MHSLEIHPANAAQSRLRFASGRMQGSALKFILPTPLGRGYASRQAGCKAVYNFVQYRVCTYFIGSL